MQNLCAFNDASMAVLLYLDRAMQSRESILTYKSILSQESILTQKSILSPRSILSQNSYALFNALLFLKKFGAELTCALEGDAVLPFLD